MYSNDLLVGNGSLSSPRAMHSNGLLVGKRSPDGSFSGPRAMYSNDLLVGRGSPRNPRAKYSSGFPGKRESRNSTPLKFKIIDSVTVARESCTCYDIALSAKLLSVASEH